MILLRVLINGMPMNLMLAIDDIDHVLLSPFCSNRTSSVVHLKSGVSYVLQEDEGHFEEIKNTLKK